MIQNFRCQFPVDARPASWLVILTVGLLAGCGGPSGPQRVAVSGKVSFDGAPVRAGVIRFVPTGKTQGPAAVAVIREGVFALPADEGPIVGAHRVEIEAAADPGFALDDEQAFSLNAEKGEPLPANPLPAVYNTQSRLSAQISPEGDQQLTFSLDSQGTIPAAGS